jgi:hypothetical protein
MRGMLEGNFDSIWPNEHLPSEISNQFTLFLENCEFVIMRGTFKKKLHNQLLGGRRIECTAGSHVNNTTEFGDYQMEMNTDRSQNTFLKYFF